MGLHRECENPNLNMFRYAKFRFQEIFLVDLFSFGGFFRGVEREVPLTFTPFRPKTNFCLTKRIGTPQESTNNLQNLPYFLEFFSKILNFFKKNEKFSKKFGVTS